jgi:hypothetical protein
MSLRKGSIYSLSWNQFFNTKSLTEADLVGMDDGMPLVIWTQKKLRGTPHNVSLVQKSCITFIERSFFVECPRDLKCETTSSSRKGQ